MNKSYAEQCYERDKKSVGQLCGGFAIATVALWPLSYAISGHALTDGASWWNATTTVSWLAAAVTSIGFGITLAMRAFITPPIEGANR